jgi:hypothetical protein
MDNKNILKIFIYKDDQLVFPENMPKQQVPILEYINRISLSNQDTPIVRLTDNAEESDYILYPYFLDSLFDFINYLDLVEYINNLPYFKQFEEKHIFFLNHDLSIPFHMTSLFFRASIEASSKDINAISLPHSVEDLFHVSHFELEKCKYDVSFVGYIGSSYIRFPLIKSILQTKRNMRHQIKVFPAFHGHLDGETKILHKILFKESLRDSLMVLCPAGTGKNTIRFFEVMSMGRIPILVSDDCMLPFEDKIDYSSFILRIDENQVEKADEIIADWIESHSIDELISKCKVSRATWENYFAPEALVIQLVKTLIEYKNRDKAITTPNIHIRQQAIVCLRQYALREFKKKNYISCMQYSKPLLFPGTLNIYEAQHIAAIYFEVAERLPLINSDMTNQIMKLQS